MNNEFDFIEDAIEDLKQGKMIILVDDENRENEGDLCCAADKVTPDTINFMAKYGRGLICLALDEAQITRLNLPLMTDKNRAPFQTNFTVSIEASSGVTTGISAADRAHTILAATNPNAKPDDIVVPGHIFPLQSKIGGVLQRAGQTEGSVDLAVLAGLNPAGVICEIMNDDGTMARYPQLKAFSQLHQIKLVTVKDLIEYKLLKHSHVKCIKTETIQTHFGEFKFHIYRNTINRELYLAYVAGEATKDVPAATRVHTHIPGADMLSETIVGTQEITKILQYIQNNKPGVFLTLIKDMPLDVIERKIDQIIRPDNKAESEALSKFREYGFGAQVIRDLGFSKLKLITNHPHSMKGIQAYGLEVTDTIAIP